MTETQHFKISSFIKDIIGRDLVTNEFAAVFELVKNSLDARATKVDIVFDGNNGNIAIIDDGTGMSVDDIRDKWLFVAYSDKVDGQPGTYRDKIRSAAQFAGSKGIGRFSCDTLGKKLELYTRVKGSLTVSKLEIDWTDFEQNSTQEFQTIDVKLSDVLSFPAIPDVNIPVNHGTVLLIKETRQHWDDENIKRLRSELAKLIDPFGTTEHAIVSTRVVNVVGQLDLKLSSNLNGPIGNNISDILKQKTSRIDVKIENGKILSSLFDRGKKIYSIEEASPYDELVGCSITGEIYFLNRSAKQNFSLRMGLRPVDFGSVFLFLNKFRISPIGDEFDDTLGLNRRKQQGQARYLGTRDILGRVDVLAPPKMFREVSSRNSGLVEDARSRALFDAIRKHMIFRLERYVVEVNWKDKPDQFRDTPTGLVTDKARERILSIIGGLARSKDIKILYYDKDIVRFSEDSDQITDNTLNAMSELAKSRGDTSLFKQIDNARRRIEELKQSRDEAQKAAKQAQEERQRADAIIARLEQQAAFLGSSLDVDVDRIQLLMHEAIIQVGHLRAAITNAAGDVKELIKNVDDITEYVNGSEKYQDDMEVGDALVSIHINAESILSSLANATLSGDKLKTVLSFAPNIKVNLDTGQIRGDLLQFLSEYFEVRLTNIPDMPTAIFENSGLTLERKFSPVEMAIVVDNLLDNAHKAKAKNVWFKTKKKSATAVIIQVTDDGLGIDVERVDPSKIFERGYTSSSHGTGLGLYNVRKIIQNMGGEINLVGDGERADFEISIPGEAVSES